MNDSEILYTELNAQAKRIGVITLNRPKVLNALSHNMVCSLREKLAQWEADPEIALVFVDSNCARAFCAGGDVRALCGLIIDENGSESAYAKADDYFHAEFLMDYRVHQFSKPLVVWGDTLVMGGGLGIMAGASFRIATERSIFAMPEIAIGYIPDVGSSYFLNQMPAGVGLFAALTAAKLNAADARFANLVDYILPFESKEKFLAELSACAWEESVEHNFSRLALKFESFSCDTGLPDSNLEKHAELIAQFARAKDIQECDQILRNIQPVEPWLQDCKNAYQHGSPLSAAVLFTQLQKAKNMKLADIFGMEYAIACKFARGQDFPEGVRALLIDKDGKPNWEFDQLKKISVEHVESFFQNLKSIE